MSLTKSFVEASVSPKTEADYQAEQRKVFMALVARKTAVARLHTLKNISADEKNFLEALAAGGETLASLVQEKTDVLKTPDAIALARDFISSYLKEANGRRMMTLIERDHYYDETMQKARAGQAQLAEEKKAHWLRAQTSRKEMQSYEDQLAYYDTNIIQHGLTALRGFDRNFLAEFNGPILKFIQALMDADQALAARQPKGATAKLPTPELR